MAEDHAVRVAVGASQSAAMSSTWRVWSNNDEVYLAIRSLASIFKTSLHSSGLFRHAFVREQDSEKHQGPGKDRAVSKWSRPIPQDPSGTLMFQVIIPGLGLEVVPQQVLHKSTVIVPQYGADDVGYISVSEVAADAASKPIQFGQTKATLLDSWSLPRGTVIQVTWHTYPMSPEQLPTMRGLPQMVNARLQSLHAADTNDARYRMFFVIENPDGVGRLLDVGVKPLLRWASNKVS